MPILMSEKQAARLLGLSHYTLQKSRTRGGGIPFVKIGRAVRYRQEDIDLHLQQHKFSSTSQYKKEE